MSEPTLNAAFYDLQGDVGFFLGFGRGANNGDNAWDSFQQASIDRCVKGGLRRFYHNGYPWSFLKPVSTVTMLNGSNTVPLPDDYGGFEGEITVTTGSTSNIWEQIRLVGIGTIDELAARQPTTTGRPAAIAQEPLRGTGTNQSQRFQLKAWPTADADYTYRFSYYLNPDYLTGALPYAYGGPEHAETILEACLSVAEKILDDTLSVHEQEFMKLLEVSKELDHRKKPQYVGYNRDWSDVVHREPRYPPQHGYSPVTYNGILYG